MNEKSTKGRRPVGGSVARPSGPATLSTTRYRFSSPLSPDVARAPGSRVPTLHLSARQGSGPTRLGEEE